MKQEIAEFLNTFIDHLRVVTNSNHRMENSVRVIDGIL
jgi:hypothetical protein